MSTSLCDVCKSRDICGMEGKNMPNCFIPQKRVFIGNAFSLQMIDDTSVITTRRLSQDDVKKLINKFGFISCIGHQDTANIISNLLGIDIPMNRVSIKLESDDDILIVAQVVGGRLPEGATTLPDNITIKFLEVRLSNKSCPFSFCVG